MPFLRTLFLEFQALAVGVMKGSFSSNVIQHNPLKVDHCFEGEHVASILGVSDKPNKPVDWVA
jgi:hypothetical protein